MPKSEFAKAAWSHVRLLGVRSDSGLRAALKRSRLAPGKLYVLSRNDLRDQLFLSNQAAKYGPIFKVWWGNKLMTCIVGHELGRRFLSTNEQNIRAATTDLTPLFPFGFLRAMEGETHRKYRKIFIDAFRRTSLQEHDAAIRSIITKTLTSLSRLRPAEAATVQAALREATTEISFRLILGIDRSSPFYADLAAGYQRYAPNAPFIVARDRQKEAYAILRSHIDQMAVPGSARESAPPSLMQTLSVADQLDETVIGNLIQMTEASLYDIHGLWFWILHMLSTDPSILEGMLHRPDDISASAYALAVTQEALRLEQSEFIYRTAVKDFVFEGYYIPKRSRIRVCVWEGHRDPKRHADPNKFDATRFLAKTPGIDSYAPFGLDKHRCLGADWTLELGARFVEELARGFRLDVVTDGPPEDGVFHFEPSSRFSVNLTPTDQGVPTG